MLSGKLVHLIESHWDQIASRVIDQVRREPQMPHVRGLAGSELREMGEVLLQNLGHWLSAGNEEDLAQKYEQFGKLRCQQNVPLHESVRGLCIIREKMLDLLQKNMQDRKIHNVQTVLGGVDDPKLPAGIIDLVILVDVYHEFSEPQQMLRRMREALRPDGRLVLLEYRAEDPKVPIRPEHKMTVEQAKSEVEPEGYRLDKVLETLPRQHILIFKKNLNATTNEHR